MTAETGLVQRTTVTAKAMLDRFAATARGSVVLNAVSDVLRGEIADRSMTLAAQLFTSILPLLVVLSSIGHNDGVDRMIGWTGLPSSDQLEFDGTSTFPSTTTFSVVGVLMTIISATSYARALGRFYARTWLVPVVTVRSAWRWVAVVVATVTAFIAIGLGQLLDSAPILGGVLDVAISFVVWWVIWAYVPHILTYGHLSVRILLCAGGLAAVGLTLFRIGSALVMPRVYASAIAQFGVIGIVFTLVGWLFVFAAIVVGATLVVSSVARDEDIGRWLGSHLPSRQSAMD